MTACIDLWCDIMDSLDAMHGNKQVSLNDYQVIKNELSDALWDSCGVVQTKENLHALALHYGIDVPNETAPEDVPTIPNRKPWPDMRGGDV